MENPNAEYSERERERVHEMGETNSHKSDVIVESKRKIALGCDPKSSEKEIIMRNVH